MSQKDLAKSVGYKSASTISKIEKGLFLPYSKIESFASALKTTPDKLISYQELMGRLFEGEIIK